MPCAICLPTFVTALAYLRRWNRSTCSFQMLITHIKVDAALPMCSCNASLAAVLMRWTSRFPHRRELLGLASRESYAASIDYEATKRSLRDTALQCSRDGIIFVPMVFEPSGICGPSAERVFRQLLARSALPRGPAHAQQALFEMQRHAAGTFRAPTHWHYRPSPGCASLAAPHADSGTGPSSPWPCH